MTEHIEQPLQHTGPYGVQAVCSCGWRGPERNYMSNNYAYSQAHEDFQQHREEMRNDET